MKPGTNSVRSLAHIVIAGTWTFFFGRPCRDRGPPVPPPPRTRGGEFAGCPADPDRREIGDDRSRPTRPVRPTAVLSGPTVDRVICCDAVDPRGTKPIVLEPSWAIDRRRPSTSGASTSTSPGVVPRLVARPRRSVAVRRPDDHRSDRGTKASSRTGTGTTGSRRGNSRRDRDRRPVDRLARSFASCPWRATSPRRYPDTRASANCRSRPGGRRRGTPHPLDVVTD